MLSLIPLAMELLSYVPTAIKLGIDISAAAKQAYDLWNRPTAATQEELTALKVEIDTVRKQLDELTTRLEKDPT